MAHAPGKGCDTFRVTCQETGSPLSHLFYFHWIVLVWGEELVMIGNNGTFTGRGAMPSSGSNTGEYQYPQDQAGWKLD